MPPGRPRLLDDTKRREICALVSAGTGLPKAARYVGCSVKTIRRESQRNATFGEQLRRAEMAAQLSPLDALRRAAGTHWRAAAWILERCDPQQFGRPTIVGLGKKEVRRLADDLLKIVRREIDDPFVLERIESQMEATIQYATRSAWDTNRSGHNLKRALEYFARKDREHPVCEGANFPWDSDRGRHDSPDSVREASSPETEQHEFCPRESHEATARPAPIDGPQGQNDEFCPPESSSNRGDNSETTTQPVSPQGLMWPPWKTPPHNPKT